MPLRFSLFLTTLIALASFSLGQKPPAGAKPGQPAKPSQTAPKTPPKHPVVLLQEKVSKLLKDVEADMLAEQQYVLSIVGGKAYGRWTAEDDKGNGHYETPVPKNWGEQDIKDFKGYATALDRILDQWKKKSLDDWHALAGLGGLYQMATNAIQSAYGFANNGARLMALVWQSELDHNKDAGLERIQKQVAAEFPNVSVSNNREGYTRSLKRYDELYDKMAKELWDKLTSDALKEHAHIGISRRKWCRAMWDYYDFAKSKTANPKDGHENAVQSLLHEIDQSFSNPPRTIQSGGVPARLAWPPALVTTQKIALKSNAFAGGGVEDYPHILARQYPELQYYPDALGWIVLNFGFEPDVVALHNAKEEKSPWGVWDVRIVPPLVAGDTPATGRVQAEFDKNGNPTYILYAYGPRVPTKVSEFQGAKMAADSHSGVLYEPIAYSADFKSGKMPLPLQNRFRAAQYIVSLGLTPSGAASVKDMPGILLKATLGAGALPGYQKFTLNNAPAGWFLDQGSSIAMIQWVEKLDDAATGQSRYQPINMAHPGEDIVLEVKLNGRTKEKQVEVITGKDGTWMCPEGKLTLFLDEAPGDPFGKPIYHSQIIRLCHPNDPRLDSANSKRKPGVLYFPVSAGETVEGAFADPRKFLGGGAVTQIEIHGAPLKSLWQDALTRAAALDGIPGDITVDGTLRNKTVAEMKTFNLTQAVFRSKLRYVISPGYFLLANRLYGTDLSHGDATVTNTVKLYDHAAMILLRDHFIRLMLELNSQLGKVSGRQKEIDFMEGMRPAVMADPNHPLGAIEVSPTPAGGGSPVDAKPLRDYFSMQRKPGPTDFLIRNAFQEGFRKYKESVVNSLEHAQSIDEGKIDELLGLVGNGFTSVVESLESRLLKPVRDDSGTMTWVPDMNARAAVKGVNALFEAVRAQKEYKALDTQVVLAVASLTPVALPAGIIKTVVSLALNAVFLADSISIHAKSMAMEKERAFALGAHAILGTERFYMADLQRTPTWALVLNIVGGTLAGASGTVEIFDIMGKVSKYGAARVAQQVLFEIKEMGIPGFAKLTNEQKASFLAFAAGTDIKAAQEGVQSLNFTEQEARAAVKLLDEELKAAENAGKGAMVPRPEAPIPSTLADKTPVVTGVPTGPCKWKTPTGDTLVLGELLNKKETRYFNVFRLEGARRVVKVLKDTGASAMEAWGDIKKAIQALDDAKIPYRAIRKIEEFVDHSGYLIQDLLEFSDHAGKEAFVLQDWFDLGKELTVPMQDALIDLVRKMRKANICFEDMNLGNVYIEKLGNSYVAGVLDVDRIAYWGDFSYQMNYVMGMMQQAPHELSLRSITANFMLDIYETAASGKTILTCDEFWALTLERFDFVAFTQQGQFASARLDVRKLQDFIVTLKRRGVLDLGRRTDSRIPQNMNPHAGTPPPMLRWSWLPNLARLILHPFSPLGTPLRPILTLS